MKVLKANWLNRENLERFLRQKARTEGFLNRNPIEALSGFNVCFRPFRRITIDITSSTTNEPKRVHTLIDEELGPLVADQNHRMLLWRPRYSGLEPIESDIIINRIPAVQADKELLQVIDEVLKERLACQAYDDELRPKLKRLQADPLSAVSIILPRTSSGLRKEQKLIDERKESHAFILASSLVTNCSPRDIITSWNINDRIHIETIVAIYRSNDKEQRHLILETPGCASLDETIKAGKALTRLCELYVECRENITGMSKLSP